MSILVGCPPFSWQVAVRRSSGHDSHLPCLRPAGLTAVVHTYVQALEQLRSYRHSHLERGGLVSIIIRQAAARSTLSARRRRRSGREQVVQTAGSHQGCIRIIWQAVVILPSFPSYVSTTNRSLSVRAQQPVKHGKGRLEGCGLLTWYSCSKRACCQQFPPTGRKGSASLVLGLKRSLLKLQADTPQYEAGARTSASTSMHTTKEWELPLDPFEPHQLVWSGRLKKATRWLALW